MASDKGAGRRQYSGDLKAQVIAECDAAGSSVAKVAMSHGINANVVHRWRQLAREGAQATVPATREFLPVQLAPAAASQGEGRRDIEIELRRGAMTMKISWPQSAVADFAAWARELLR